MPREVDVREASQLPVLVDVREPDEWAAGHAPQAISLPLSQFDPALVPTATEVAFICKVGGRSARAAAAMAARGVATVNVRGGMLAWAEAGLPVVTDEGGAGTVLQ